MILELLGEFWSRETRSVERKVAMFEPSSKTSACTDFKPETHQLFVSGDSPPSILVGGLFFVVVLAIIVVGFRRRKIPLIARSEYRHHSAYAVPSQSHHLKLETQKPLTFEVPSLREKAPCRSSVDGKSTVTSFSGTLRLQDEEATKENCSLDPSDWGSFLGVFGHSMVDYVVQYHRRIASKAVRRDVKPGFLEAQLPTQRDFPNTGENWCDIMADVEKHIMPNMLHWQHPRFFGCFPTACSPPSVLADFFASILNVISFSWESGPASTELETMVMDSLARAIGLPETFTSAGDGGGALQLSVTESVLCTVVAARTNALRHMRRTNPDANELELMAKMTLYASDQAHPSVEKAANVVGLGTHFRRIPSHGGGESSSEANSMDVEKLASAMEKDRAKGLTPVFVCATVGTTFSCAIDPVCAIAQVCQRHGAISSNGKRGGERSVDSTCDSTDTFVPWLHIDAAYAGGAAVCEEYRWILNGVEYADSFLISPDTWFLMNPECVAMWVQHKGDFTNGLTMNSDIVRYEEYERGEAMDFKDWQMPLSRRFRSLKVWITMRIFGLEKIREHLRFHILLAQELASLIRKDPRFEILAPVRLGLVCFRFKDTDAANLELRSTVNSSGQAFFSCTKIRGRVVLGICVGGTHTKRQDIQEMWKILENTADSMDKATQSVSGERTN